MHSQSCFARSVIEGDLWQFSRSRVGSPLGPRFNKPQADGLARFRMMAIRDLEPLSGIKTITAWVAQSQNNMQKKNTVNGFLGN
jgi:hypothetical protein